MVEVAFRNKIAARCAACGSRLAAGAGYSWRDPRRGWRSVCASTACARRAGVRLPDTRRRMALEHVGGQLRIVIRMPYEKAALPVLAALPDGRWHREERFRSCSADPADRSAVLEVADKLGLEVEPCLREIDLGDEIAGLVDEARQAGAREYQLRGIEWLAAKDRALLADDMGLGKTFQAVWSIPRGGRAIVVCPANVKYTWRAEVARWRPELTAVVCSGRKGFRLPAAGEVVVVNYDILPGWLQLKEERKGGRLVVDISGAPNETEVRTTLAECVLVLDEVHRAKNFKALRTKRVRALGKLCQRVIGMTGTPLMNRAPDLWGVLMSVGVAYAAYGSWSSFARLFGGRRGRFGWEWPDPRKQPPSEQAAARLQRVMLRRTKAEVLPELPAKTRKIVECNGVPRALGRQLDELWERYRPVVESGVMPDFEEVSEVRAALALARIPATVEQVELHEEQDLPLVVFSAHRAPIDELAKREGWAVITGSTTASERQRLVDAFQAGELRGLGLTIKAGCEGLTLTRAAHALFVDLEWVPALNLQAEDRICRLGQQAEALIYTQLVSDHPFDKRVRDLLEQKMKLIEEVVDKQLTYDGSEPAQIKDETDEEWLARLDERKRAQIEAEAHEAREAHQRYVRETCERLRGRAARPERELTPELIQALKEAYSYMLSVCDGARTQDGMGFSKPDVGIARALMTYDLDDIIAQRALERLLSRYHRQLSERWPIIFRG